MITNLEKPIQDNAEKNPGAVKPNLPGAGVAIPNLQFIVNLEKPIQELSTESKSQNAAIEDLVPFLQQVRIFISLFYP